MIILGLDVSTTSTGLTLLDKENKTLVTRLFKAEGLIGERVKKIYIDIRDFLKTHKYDVMVVSKATHRNIHPSINMLEGMLLALSIDSGAKFDYNPDISWYTFIGATRDQRPLKKSNTLNFFLKTNNLEDKVRQIVPIYAGKNMNGIYALLKDDTVINDDIADSFACAWFYDERLKKKEVSQQKNKLQEELNSLRKENKKLLQSIKGVSMKISTFENEIKLFKKRNEIEKTKRTDNSILNRKSKISGLAYKGLELNSKLQANKEKISKLMKKKNTI